MNAESGEANSSVATPMRGAGAKNNRGHARRRSRPG